MPALLRTRATSSSCRSTLRGRQRRDRDPVFAAEGLEPHAPGVVEMSGRSCGPSAAVPPELNVPEAGGRGLPRYCDRLLVRQAARSVPAESVAGRIATSKFPAHAVVTRSPSTALFRRCDRRAAPVNRSRWSRADSPAGARSPARIWSVDAQCLERVDASGPQRAGTIAPASATAARSSDATATVSGSRGPCRTAGSDPSAESPQPGPPKSKPERDEDCGLAHEQPRHAPARAPSAIRMPTSRVRRVTVYAITPYRPITASSVATG